jgi:uncharacterized protein
LKVAPRRFEAKGEKAGVSREKPGNASSSNFDRPFSIPRVPREAGNLAKLVLTIAVALIVYSIVRNYLRRRDRQVPGPAPRNNEDMVRCAYCGVHLPVSESMLSKGEYFCGNEHRMLHSK